MAPNSSELRTWLDSIPHQRHSVDLTPNDDRCSHYVEVCRDNCPRCKAERMLAHSREEAASAALVRTNAKFSELCERLIRKAELIRTTEGFSQDQTLILQAREIESAASCIETILALSPDPKWLERQILESRANGLSIAFDLIDFHGGMAQKMIRNEINEIERHLAQKPVMEVNRDRNQNPTQVRDRTEG